MWATAIAAGKVDTLTDRLGLDVALDRLPRLSKKALVRGATALGVHAPLEAGTEVLQTMLERVGARKSLTDAEARRDYVDSGAVGALGGGTIGGVRALRSEPDAPVGGGATLSSSDDARVGAGVLSPRDATAEERAPAHELAARQQELQTMDPRDPYRPLVQARIQHLEASLAPRTYPQEAAPVAKQGLTLSAARPQEALPDWLRPIDGPENLSNINDHGDQTDDLGRALESAYRLGSGSDRAGQSHGRGVTAESLRASGAIRELDTRAFERGVAGFENLGRNEHTVVHPEGSGRVYKITKAGEYGAPGGVVEYLERLRESNRLFDDDIQLVGAVRDSATGQWRLVISQPWIAKARQATPSEIEAYLKTKGFFRYTDRAFYNPVTEMLISDAESVNVLVGAKGKIAPIDVIPHRVPPSRAEMYENVVRRRQADADGTGLLGAANPHGKSGVDQRGRVAGQALSPQQRKLVQTVQAFVKYHAAELAALGHSPQAVVGPLPAGNESGLAVHEGVLTIDPAKLERATARMNRAQRAAFLKAAVAEEVVHLGFHRFISDTPANVARALAVLENEPAAVALARETYPGFAKLEPLAQAAEVVRIIMQGRTGVTTESTWRFINDLLARLRKVLRRLKPATRAVIGEIDTRMGPRWQAELAARKEAPARGQKISNEPTSVETPGTANLSAAEAAWLKSSDGKRYLGNLKTAERRRREGDLKGAAQAEATAARLRAKFDYRRTDEYNRTYGPDREWHQQRRGDAWAAKSLGGRGTRHIGGSVELRARAPWGDPGEMGLPGPESLRISRIVQQTTFERAQKYGLAITYESGKFELCVAPGGRVFLLLDWDFVARKAWKAAEGNPAAFHYALWYSADEEIAHGVWAKEVVLKSGGPEEQTPSVNPFASHVEQVAQDMIATVNALPQNEREDAIRTAAGVLLLYERNPPGVHEGMSPGEKINAIWEAIQSDQDVQSVWVCEAVRQFAQYERTGSCTELSPNKAISPSLHEMLAGILGQSWAMIKAEKLGKKLLEDVMGTHAVLVGKQP